jgi:hypothetical protein
MGRLEDKLVRVHYLEAENRRLRRYMRLSLKYLKHRGPYSLAREILKRGLR